jgi:hypothetical protein
VKFAPGYVLASREVMDFIINPLIRVTYIYTYIFYILIMDELLTSQVKFCNLGEETLVISDELSLKQVKGWACTVFVKLVLLSVQTWELPHPASSVHSNF